jgi:TfoX/Sxy family transcriptional regulator of competence genes
MPYDEALADRVRSIVGALHPGPIDEKRMFGGLALMLNGNMAVVVRGRGGLMIRVDPAEADAFAAEPGAEATEMRGRTMRGWISVSPDVLAEDADLRRWVGRGVSFTATLSRPKGR